MRSKPLFIGGNLIPSAPPVFRVGQTIKTVKEHTLHLGVCQHPKMPKGTKGRVLKGPSSKDDHFAGHWCYEIYFEPWPAMRDGFETRMAEDDLDPECVLDLLAWEAP